MNPTEMKAVLFAAGLGTRLKPFTNTSPKALFPVNDKPLLQRNIEYLKKFGFRHFIINVHHFADQIISFLEENNNFGVQIEISDERKQLLETGGGLLKMKDLLGSKPFLVMNADILTDMAIDEFIRFHQKMNPLVSLAITDRESSRKLLFNSNYRLCGWKNLKSGESIIENPDFHYEMAFSGIHIIHPYFFELNTYRGNFSIMKPYMHLMQNHEILGYNHSGGKLLDVGKQTGVEQAEKMFL